MTMYFLSSCSVVIDTILPNFLFRLILSSVCTVTIWEGSWFWIMFWLHQNSLTVKRCSLMLCHVSLFVPGFNELGYVSRLDKYNRICFIINRLFLQSIDMPIRMCSRPCGDVSTDNLIRMTLTWHAYFSCKLPWNLDHFIISKHKICHFDARRCQKSVEFFMIWF